MITKSRMVMKTSVFPAPIDVVWHNLSKYITMQFISKPLVSFTPVGNAEDLIWREGEIFLFRICLLGIIPFGIHSIRIDQFDRNSFRIFTLECNKTVPVWNHRIVLRELAKDRTEYTDEVEIYAGWKTLFVCEWAKQFYAHRQRKWKKLLKTLGYSFT